MSDNPKHQRPVQVIGNVPVRSIGAGDINPNDPVQIVGKDRDGVFWAVPYGAAAKGFDWSSSPDGTSVAAVGGITAVRSEGPEVMISEDGLVVDASDQLTAAIAERDAARGEVRQWKQQAEQLQASIDDLKARLAIALEARGAWRAAALSALSDAQKAADAANSVSAGDGGDGILQPSTAAYSAAVSLPKLGDR